MKTMLFFTIALFGIIAIGCTATKEKTAEELLGNPKMEEDIYMAILKDSAHLSKLMSKIMADENSKEIMAKNNSLVRMVCMSEKVDTLIMKDKEIRESLSGRLINVIGADSFPCDKTCTKTVEAEFIEKYSKRKYNKNK